MQFATTAVAGGQGCTISPQINTNLVIDPNDECFGFARHTGGSTHCAIDACDPECLTVTPACVKIISSPEGGVPAVINLGDSCGF